MELADGQTAQNLGSAQDLVIVSAFGRGNWLAQETARRGWKTTLVDISDSLAPFKPEEIEGPFGLFETDDLLPSQIARVKEEGECHPVREGFNLWLKDGPLEFRGPMVSHQLLNKFITSDLTQYLLNTETDKRGGERKALEKKEFVESWLAHLSHQITAPFVCENQKALSHGDHLPVFAPFSIRQVTDTGMKAGLEACAAAGVRVLAKARVRDVAFNGREAVSVSVQEGASASASTTIEGHAFVWMLSSSETRVCPPEVLSQLFPAGVLEPSWCWSRLRFDLEADDAEILEGQLPAHTVIMQDPFLPWTHSNLLVMRKRSEALGFDVWAKLPVHFLSQASRLETFAVEVKARLEARVPKSKFIYKPSDEVAGAVIRQPLFERRDLQGLSVKKSSNLFFCGPEQWDFTDWLGAYRAQNRLFPSLEKIKTQTDARLARLAAKAAAREAREKAAASRNIEKGGNP